VKQFEIESNKQPGAALANFDNSNDRSAMSTTPSLFRSPSL
jgi:hypothetical protein